MSGKVGRPPSVTLTKRKLFIDEFLNSVTLRDLMKKLQEQRPIIFVLCRNNQVDEYIVLAGAEVLDAEHLGKFSSKDMLKQKVSNGLAVAKEAEIAAVEEAVGQDELPPEEPEPPVIIPTKAPTSSVEIVREAISEVAKSQGSEGEVAVGRWVEFESADKSIQQGRVSFITPDESSILLTLRDGKSVLVKAEKLINLIPEVV